MRLPSAALTTLLAAASLATIRYDDEGSVPLPRGVRNRIGEISRAERNLGCS